MNTIDYIYRFDPENPAAKPVPPNADAARRMLEDGNRLFSQWMESCRSGTPAQGEPRVRRAVQRPRGGDGRAPAAKCPSSRRSQWSSAAPTLACRPRCSSARGSTTCS